MTTIEQACRDLTERIKEVRSAYERVAGGDITGMERKLLQNMERNSGYLGALIRLANEWREIEQLLDYMDEQERLSIERDVMNG